MNLEKGSTKKSNDTNSNGRVDLRRVELSYPGSSGYTGPVPENRNENLVNKTKRHADIAKVKVSPKPESIEFCQGNNIGEFDLSEVPEFALDDNFFMEEINPHVGSSIMDDNYEKCMGMEIMPYYKVPTLMQGEVNKEIDLMEMISRVNN